MTVSLAEVTKSLLSGSTLSWPKFESHKAGTITLETPGARRLFEFLRNQKPATVAMADGSLFDDLISAWEDEESDPTTSSVPALEGRAGGSWRLGLVEACGYGGLTMSAEKVFSVQINGENWCLEGQNGSGKTAFVSAIIWAMIGQRIREQDGLVDDGGQRAPVLDEHGAQIGTWPPIAAYPPAPADLETDAEVWVRLSFKNENGDTAVAYRKVRSPVDGDPIVEESIDPRLLIAPQLIETGLLMPARLSHIGFGDKSQSLYEAVKLLTGLDQLADIADGAARFTHKGQRFLKFAKDQGIDQLKNQFDESIVKARVEAIKLEINISKLHDLGREGLIDELRETAKAASKQAGENLAKLQKDIAADIDTGEAAGRAKIQKAVGAARAVLNQGIDGVDVFQSWAALKGAADDNKFQNLPEKVGAAQDDLAEALKWHQRQLDDQKLRLKALAAQYFIPPCDSDAIAECPLCESELTTEEQKALASELAQLKTHAKAAERKLEDACAAIEKELRQSLSAQLRARFDLLSIMDPRDAYVSAALDRFASNPPFSDVLVGIAGQAESTVAQQKMDLPKFSYPDFGADMDSAPQSEIELKRFIHSLERLISLAAWWTKHRQAFVDAWFGLIGKEDEEGNWPAKCIEIYLRELEQAVEEAEPLDALSKHLTAAADAAESWSKIQEKQKIRETIAEALVPLKELRHLVGAETARSISTLSDRIKSILSRIHLQERLSYEDASLAKKSVNVEGSFNSGMQIDAASVANTSWLRAILWAFVMALREQTTNTLDANPFPLVVLDDPQKTFDPRNKRKWAEELARVANINPSEKDGMQLLIVTHERQFAQCLMNHEKLKAQQGLLAAVNEISGVCTFVNGSCLERAYKDAKAANDDGLAHKYVADVRIYCEDLLKFVLRAEGPDIGGKSLEKLGLELKRLRDAHVAPFNRVPFVALLKTLKEGGGGKPLKLINNAHHTADGSIGVAEADDVKEFWDDTLEKQIYDCFRVYCEYEAHIGEPRVFPWEANVAVLPDSKGGEVEKATLSLTGVAAAAKSDGRAGDGVLTFEEWSTRPEIHLHNHEVYQLAAGTLDPVAGIGDVLIVSNYAKVNPRNLVVLAFGSRCLARRYNETDVHPDIGILTGQSVDPLALPQPIVVPRDGVQPRKIVGTIFASHLLPIPPKDDENEVIALSDYSIVSNALDNARLFEVKGRSAEPIALDGQFLITHPLTFSSTAVAEIDGRLVIAIDESGTRYFKRLRIQGPIIILESLNTDGLSPPELLSLDGTNGLPKLIGLLEVVGVLFEKPSSCAQSSEP